MYFLSMSYAKITAKEIKDTSSYKQLTVLVLLDMIEG